MKEMASQDGAALASIGSRAELIAALKSNDASANWTTSALVSATLRTVWLMDDPVLHEVL